MKKNTILMLLMALVVVAALAWFFMRPSHYCEVVYSNHSGTKQITVSCNEDHCDKLCLLKYRKKGSEDPWTPPDSLHSYDTAVYEYQCRCRSGN